MKFKAKLIILLLLLIGSCTNEKVKTQLKIEPIPESKKDQIIMARETDGTYYSDSIIAALTAPIEVIKIDSFADLHTFDITKFQFEHCNEITIEMLRALDVNGLQTGIKKI